MDTNSRERPAPSGDRLVLFTFVIALLLGFALRVTLIAQKSVLEYDDAISLLAASGHEGEYARISAAYAPPLGEWTTAAAWQRLLQPEPGRGLDVVAADLAEHDIHPPLYFWLLAVWIRLAGSSLFSLHAVNLVFDLALALGLLWAGRREGGSLTAGVILAAAWALSPVALKTTPWVRQYSLLALFALFFAYFLYLSFGKPRPLRPQWSDLGLLLAAVGGLLSQYFFALLLAAGGLLAGVRLAWRGRLRAAVVIVPAFLLAALALFLLLNPGVFSSLLVYLDSKLAPLTQPGALLYRLQSLGRTALLLALPTLGSLGLVALAGWLSGRWAGLREAGLRLREERLFVWMAALSLLTGGLVAGAYLAGLLPQHTMSSRYLGFLSPLVAFTAGIPLLKRTERWIPRLYAAGLCMLGLAALLPGLAQGQEGRLAREELREAPAVLIDSIEWGTWPMIVQHLQPDQKVLTGYGGFLVDNPHSWLEGLSQGGIYAAIVRGEENPLTTRKAMLDILQQHFQIEEISRLKRPGDWEIRLYRLEPGG